MSTPETPAAFAHPWAQQPADHRAWAGALAAALALHAGMWVLLQRPPAPLARPGMAKTHAAPMTWQVRMVRPAPVPVAPPAPAPAPVPAPPPAPIPAATPSTAPALPRPRRTPQAVPPPASPPSPTAARPAPRAPASDTPLWLDATRADAAPVPLAGEWVLADMPWPPAHPVVRVQLWITSEGRIERFALQGPAAADPAMQQLFARFADTPMQPARLGQVPVPSTMLIEIWPGTGSAPDYVLPLPLPAR